MQFVSTDWVNLSPRYFFFKIFMNAFLPFSKYKHVYTQRRQTRDLTYIFSSPIGWGLHRINLSIPCPGSYLVHPFLWMMMFASSAHIGVKFSQPIPESVSHWDRFYFNFIMSDFSITIFFFIMFIHFKKPLSLRVTFWNSQPIFFLLNTVLSIFSGPGSLAASSAL